MEHAACVLEDDQPQLRQPRPDGDDLVELLLVLRDHHAGFRVFEHVEEFLRGRVSEVKATLAQRAVQKGEITLLISREKAATGLVTPVKEAVRRLISGGVDRMDAIKRVAKERGLAKREVYDELER